MGHSFFFKNNIVEMFIAVGKQKLDNAAFLGNSHNGELFTTIITRNL